MVLTNFPEDPLLDLPPYVGQRQATYRFDRYNFVTGEVLGQLHPIRGAVLQHDTSRTIKRTLTVNLGVEDTSTVDPLQDRIVPYMVFPDGAEYPLGVYMFTDDSKLRFTSGRLGTYILNDEMFLVDQKIQKGVGGVALGDWVPVQSVTNLLADAMEGVPVQFTFEASRYGTTQGWPLGTNRGVILEALATVGDWFSPWFDNTGVMRLIRTFDPEDQIPDFDLDAGNQVIRASINEADNLLTAPNVFIVVSNNSQNNNAEVVGRFEIPAESPQSQANRGFAIVDIQQLQVIDEPQAAAVAQSLALKQPPFKTAQLDTAPDPRHDSYNVVYWQGENWMEMAWSLTMTEGGVMSHQLRKAF